MSEQNIIYNSKTIAEMTGGIILTNYKKDSSVREGSYQSEAELENELLRNLVAQGYEKVKITNNEELYNNLRKQVERLNKLTFNDSEWQRFLLEYLDKPNEGMIEKTRKIQQDHIYDFTFDDGMLKNIKILDKKIISNNSLQVTNQFVQQGKYQNRYDVTILVNGLPLVQVELKRRGVNLHEAFNQIHRYSRESYNSTHSLFQYVQIFVISNGTYTRYFANTTATTKNNNYEFTCEWADSKNKVIKDLVDFTKTFFERRVLLEILTKYCVFDVNNILLIMRPYQICATERILWKIKSSYESKKAGSSAAGGYIWHTTGSGKTLTSFKTARLATELEFIDKVFFVVDRKDLDYQTMKEYQKFQEDSVNGSKDTRELKRSIEKEDNRIVVTTIQKLNEFIKKNPNHDIYKKQVVLIFDECHRSQFGQAQKNIRKSFKKYYQFGFTGTPIFSENSLNGETTASTFGALLHSYVITDAIRDGKVLKFKVDYNNVSPSFIEAEKELTEEEIALNDEKKKDLKRINQNNKLLLHSDRIASITKYILEQFDRKTHRNEYQDTTTKRKNGFNAMFAVSEVDAAKLYYDEFKKQQSGLSENERLRVATIFSYQENESSSAIGEIDEESFDTSSLLLSSKQFLEGVIKDYNQVFKTNFTINGNDFQNYYKDLSQRVKDKEVDLLIVVGMFLTGFDAPGLNTLFVDKNLQYHGLIQAYSRTNRILNSVKTFGNIVCFRDLEKATENAIKTFGDENSLNVILERSYNDYLNGFKDEETGKIHKGYKQISEEINEKFPDPTEIVGEKDRKEFANLFGELLRTENILKNFDEFDNFENIITDRQLQDMKSVYVDIREEVLKKKDSGGDLKDKKIDFNDIKFEIDLLKTQEVNLDYILTLILEKSKDNNDKDEIKEEINRLIRSTIDVRAKEELVMEFINETDFDDISKPEDLLQSFYNFARDKKEKNINEIIQEENLKEGANLFINKLIQKGEVNNTGVELDTIIPPTSRRRGARDKKKQQVMKKLEYLVDVFVGI